MYLGVDIGGTKTLIAVLDQGGTIVESTKFPTPSEYPEFLHNLSAALAGLKTEDFKAAGVGMPVTVYDRVREIGINFGNLPWKNVSVGPDIEQLVHCPTVVNNDAKLGGLSEAMLLKDQYQRVLYLTVSTGIGIGFTVGGVIDNNVGDSGGAALMLEHQGKFAPWEHFAGGHAIVERYGKKAQDINDDATWKAISRDLSKGIIELIALLEPEVIVFGGSVGTYFERYGAFLQEALEAYKLPLVSLPKLVQAKRPEEAVVYGCFDLIMQEFSHHATAA